MFKTDSHQPVVLVRSVVPYGLKSKEKPAERSARFKQ